MKIRQQSSKKGIIAWFASNHVAANLLMILILVAGVLSSFSLQKQTNPEFQVNRVRVSVSYLGAAPQEVEEGVVIKIEEAIQDVDGIVEISSTAREGVGVVSAEVDDYDNMDEVLNDIKTRVDAITTFPALTEKPVYSKAEFVLPVIFVTIHGDIDEFTRKAVAEEVRNELLQQGLVIVQVERHNKRPCNRLWQLAAHGIEGLQKTIMYARASEVVPPTTTLITQGEIVSREIKEVTASLD